MTPPDTKPARFDKERTRQRILDAARQEFEEHGLTGARVEAIAARTDTVKRMIYYYFGSKEGLYRAVLEQAYAGIRDAESTLHLSDLPPVEAIRTLVGFTFDYQEANPGLVRLVSIENIHNGVHMAQSDQIAKLNSGVVAMVSTILERGWRDGVFRTDVDSVDVHMLITALCYFRVSNRHTFGLLFGRDFAEPAVRAQHKRLIADAVLRVLERRDETKSGQDGAGAPDRRAAAA